VPEDSVRPETQTLIILNRRKEFVGVLKYFVFLFSFIYYFIFFLYFIFLTSTNTNQKQTNTIKKTSLSLLTMQSKAMQSKVMKRNEIAR